MRTKPTVNLHDFHFYRDPLDISIRDQDELRKQIADPNAFQEGFEDHLCGGFHPDFQIEWRVGNETIQMQICLGCHEVRLYGPNELFRYDIKDDAYQALAGLLRKHHKNLPPSRRPVEDDVSASKDKDAGE